jgi:hypothetical protein
MKLQNGLTPQKAARQIVLKAILNASVAPQEMDDHGMTSAQAEKVAYHLMKIYGRLAKQWPESVPGNEQSNVTKEKE